MARRKKRLAQRLQSATSPGEDASNTPPPVFGAPDEDDRPVELAAFVGASLVGLLIIMGLAVLFGVRSVEGTLESQTLGLLRANGIRDVEVDATGLELTLNGTVRQEDHVGLAIEDCQQRRGRHRRRRAQRAVRAPTRRRRNRRGARTVGVHLARGRDHSQRHPIQRSGS